MIEFNGQLDEKLLRRVMQFQMRSLTIVAAVMLIGFVSVLLRLRLSELLDPRLLIVLLPVYLLTLPYLSARRAFKTNSMITSPLHGTADDEHITFTNEFGHSNVPWSKFYRCRIARDLVLLHVSAQQTYVIARRYFATDSDWNEFVRLVTSKVKQHKEGRAFIRSAILWFVIIVLVFLLWSLARK